MNLPLCSPLGHPGAQQALFCGKSSFSSHILTLETLKRPSQGGVMLGLVGFFFFFVPTEVMPSAKKTPQAH